jgi:hypothetical protein
MKRLAGAVVLGTIVFAAVLASASALPVSNSFIQSGGDINLTCQTNPISVGWGTMVTGDGRFHVQDVVIGNVDPDCYGHKVLVSMVTGHPTGSGASMVGFLYGPLDNDSSTTLSFTPSGSGPLASVVDEVQVLIKDALSPW